MLAPFRLSFLLIVVTFISSCQKENSVSPLSSEGKAEKYSDLIITSTPSEYFNNLFTCYGGGWTGGDATYSIALPDGRTVWLFGDTFLDTVYPDRTRPYVGFIHNSFVVQNGDDLTTLYSGTPENPAPFVSPANANQWYWPLDGFVVNNKLFVFLSRFKQQGSGMFGFKLLGVDIAKFSLPDITLQSITTVTDDPTIMWGAAVCEDANYAYVYGVKSVSFTKETHVARIDLSHLAQPMVYWNGSAWINDPLQSVNVRKDVSQEFAVFKYNGKFYLLTQELFLGPKIFLYDSASPTGPFQNKRKVYTTPETGGNIFTYNAFAHPQFMDDGKLLVSYNINSTNFNDLFTNADNYRPKFIYAEGWQ